MTISLTKLAETANTITVGWAPVPGAIGYRFTFEHNPKPSHTWEPAFSRDPNFSACNTRISKASGKLTVEALTVKDSGVYPPASPPSGVTYPASYFTGPLGNNVPLPPKKGAFLIVFGVGVAMQDYWPQHQQKIVAREAAMGRKYDAVMTTDYEQYGEWGMGKLRWIHEGGRLPIVAALHFDMDVTRVANGDADAQIDRYADHWKSLGFTIMVRLFHEMDMPQFSYTCVGREADFVKAWRRVVDRFRARGAMNVGFWWCPTEGVSRASADASYPGDTYVDWVGTDSYDWGGGWSTPKHPNRATFAEIFDYRDPYPDPRMAGVKNRHDIYGPRKPFVIGETGTVYQGDPAWKAAWFRDIPAAAKQMEHLVGVSFYDQDVSYFEGPTANFLVDHPSSSPEIMQAFVAMARDPWFNTRV